MLPWRVLVAIFLSAFPIASVLATTASPAPVELPPTDATGMVVFVLIMLLVIAGYIAWVVKQQRDKQARDQSSERPEQPRP